jgi:hypothetical protein
MLPYAPGFTPAVADPAAAVAPPNPAPATDAPLALAPAPAADAPAAAATAPAPTTAPPILPEVAHPGPSPRALPDSNKADSSAPGPSKSS